MAEVSARHFQPKFRATISFLQAQRLGIYALILLPFVGEVLYGMTLYLDISLPSGARLIRAVVSGAGLVMLLRRPMKPLSLYVWLICALWIFCFGFWAATSSFLNAIPEVVALFQLLYGFFLLVILHALTQKNDNDELLVPAFLALTTGVSALLIFSFVTGIGLDTYGDYTFGTKSFFSVGNGLSFLMISGLAFSCERLLRKPGTYSILTFAMHFLGCIFLGSATSILGAFLVAGIYFMVYLIFHPARSTTRMAVKAVLVILAGSIIAYSSVMTYRFVTEYPYMIDKAERTVREGPRGKFIRYALKRFSERPFTQNMLGEGTTGLASSFAAVNPQRSFDPSERLMIEVDPLDLYGSYGVLFAILVYVPFLLWFGWALNDWFHRPSLRGFTATLIIFLALSLSVITGHIVFVPTSTTVTSIIAAVLWARRTRLMKSPD